MNTNGHELAGSGIIRVNSCPFVPSVCWAWIGAGLYPWTVYDSRCMAILAATTRTTSRIW